MYLHWVCFCKGSAGPGKGEASDEDDDNEFFDAMEEAPEFITVPADPHFHKWVPVLFAPLLHVIHARAV